MTLSKVKINFNPQWELYNNKKQVFSVPKKTAIVKATETFVFSSVIKPGTVKGRPQILAPNTTQTSSKLILVAKILIYIQEVPQSNLRPKTRDISCHLRSSHANAEKSP
jgi:hypothetical protein